MSAELRIVLADDHPVVRAGLRAVVESQPDLSVVADFDTGESLLTWISAGGHADVALMDLRFGADQMSGAEATAALVAQGGPPVLIVTTYGSDADILAAIEAGATGYLLKDAPTLQLAEGIRAAAAGSVILGPAVQERLLERMRVPEAALTRRELDVLARVAAGDSNEDVAAELFITRATVKSHLAHVYLKLGVQSRTEAIAVARDRGLLRA